MKTKYLLYSGHAVQWKFEEKKYRWVYQGTIILINQLKLVDSYDVLNKAFKIHPFAKMRLW